MSDYDTDFYGWTQPFPLRGGDTAVNRLFPNFVCYEPVTSGPTRPTSM
jgi:hypothetical protein